MGEQIHFPKNYESYLKKAMEQFLAGNMQRAAMLFEQAYSLKQEGKTNAFYATALFQIGEYEKARDIADEKVDYYESQESLHAFYVSILIKCHQFLQAEKIIRKQLPKFSQGESNKRWTKLSEMLENEKQQAQERMERRNKEIVKQVFSIGDKTFQQQITIAKEMESLPFQSYVLGAKSILSNPFVSEVVKTATIEGLLQRGIDEPFDLVWFDERHQINPINLPALEETEAVRSVMHLLEETLANENPVMYQAILQEANLHFILLYPFIDRVIQNPEAWLQLYLERYDVMNPSINYSHLEDSKKKEQQQWMDKLNQRLEDWLI